MFPALPPGHRALRKGRWSHAGSEYFITICTHGRRTGLHDDPMVKGIFSEMHRLQAEDIWRPNSAVVMPDHIHLLVTLGPEVDLSDAGRLFKGRLTPILRKSALRWQKAYYDHRLRSAEDRLPVFLYLFLNPYRAGLISRGRRWPGYFCAKEEWEWFGPMSDNDVPFPEWLA